MIVAIGATTRTAPLSVSDHVTIVSGNGVAVSSIQGEITFPYDPSQPHLRKSVISLEDVTIDGNGRNVALTLSRYGGPARARLRNVRFINYTGHAIVADGVAVDARGVTFAGDGRAVTVLGDAPFRLQNFTVTGGLGGFFTANDGIRKTKIVLLNGVIDLGYQNRAGHETIATFTDTSATLQDLPAGGLSFPDDAYTVLRAERDGAVTLGRVTWAVGNTLTVTKWRTVANGPAPTPSAGTIRLVRRSAQDFGGVQLTGGVRGAVVENVTVRNSYSDAVTLAGAKCVARNCVAEGGQDMGFSVFGPHTLDGCTARNVQFNGFISMDAGGGILIGCKSEGNFLTHTNDEWAHWTRVVP